jgi:hypothetical protein
MQAPRMEASRTPHAFERHPALATVALALCVALLWFGIAEITARVVISYNPQYYTIVGDAEGEIHFPFGVIRINSLGYPDDEFDLEDPRPRIGYVGDSVTYGIGAGHGHRFSDLIEKRFSHYQHMTLGSVGEGFRSQERIESLVKEAKLLGIDLLIYFYNLNDTLPHAETFGNEAAPDDPWYLGIFHFLQTNTHFFRQHSYFLNWVRYRARILLGRLGIEQTGYRAFELFPSESGAVIESVAARINYLDEKLRNSGIAFAVVLLPYEMQISSEAERTYAAMGVLWDKEFIARGPQERLGKTLAPEILVYDAYEAFIDVPGDRDDIAVGQFFVFDRGDMLDWNHPNRAGHARIANWLAKIPLLRDPACWVAADHEQMSGGPAGRLLAPCRARAWLTLRPEPGTTRRSVPSEQTRPLVPGGHCRTACAGLLSPAALGFTKRGHRQGALAPRPMGPVPQMPVPVAPENEL